MASAHPWRGARAAIQGRHGRRHSGDEHPEIRKVRWEYSLFPPHDLCRCWKKMVVMMMMMIQWILFWGPIFFPSAIPVMNPIWILWQSFCPVARWEAIHPAFREPPSEPLMLFGEAGGRRFCCSFFAEHLGNTRGKGLKDLHKTPTHQKTIRIHN